MEADVASYDSAVEQDKQSRSAAADANAEIAAALAGNSAGKAPAAKTTAEGQKYAYADVQTTGAPSTAGAKPASAPAMGLA